MLGLAAGAAGPSRGQLLPAGEEPAELRGEQVRYDARRELYEARGDVRIRAGQRRIEAEWILFNARTRRGIAAGDVRFFDGVDELRAELVEFDLARETGWIHEAEIDTGPDGFRIRAREMERGRDGRWWLAGGSFRPCRCPDPEAREPWRLRAREARVELGGYAEARDARLEVLEVPVLWFPWILFPVKTERESGVLLPRVGLGDRIGFEVGLPLFWAAHPQVGVIATPRISTERGFRPTVEAEAVYGQRAFAEMAGSYGRDPSVEAGDAIPRDRGYLVTAQRHELPEDYTLRLDGALLSDNDTVLDFAELRPLRDARHAELRAALWRHSDDDGRLGLWAVASQADDLQRSDRFDRDDALLQRWPAARLALAESPMPGALQSLTLTADAEWVRFDAWESARGATGADAAEVSADGRFLDVGADGVPAGRPGNVPGLGEGNGRFDEGELPTDRGQRLWLHPRLAWPTRLGPLRLRPELGWQQRIATSEDESLASRGLLTARAEASTVLGRRFASGRSHELVPYLQWALVHGPEADDEPLFSPAAARETTRLRAFDFDLWTRDDSDRPERAHRLGLGLRQHLASPAPGGGRRRRLAADAVLTWDFAEQEPGPAALSLWTGRFAGVSLRGWLELDPEAGEVDDGSAELRWQPLAGVVLRGGYRFLRDLPPFVEAFDAGESLAGGLPDTTQLEAGATLSPGPLRLGYDVTLAPDDGGLLRQGGFVDYLSRCDCWALGVELRDDRVQGLQGFLRFALGGVGGPAPPLRTGLGF